MSKPSTRRIKRKVLGMFLKKKEKNSHHLLIMSDFVKIQEVNVPIEEKKKEMFKTSLKTNK